MPSDSTYDPPCVNLYDKTGCQATAHTEESLLRSVFGVTLSLALALSASVTAGASVRPAVMSAATAKSPAHVPAGTAAGVTRTQTHTVAAAQAGSRPFVLGYYLPGAGSLQSLEGNYQDLSAIAPLWFGIHADGSVQHRSGGSLSAIVNLSHSLGRKVFVLVTNMAQDRILVNPTIRQTAVQNLVRTLVQSHVDGVNIDFESIDGTDAQGLVDFVSAVHAQLAPLGILTTVAVGPRAGGRLPLSDESDAYSYAALGRVSDYVVLMTYDQHSAPGGAGPIAAMPWVRNVVNYAVSQIPPAKLLLGIAAYGYDWSQPGIPTVTARQAISQIQAGGVHLGWSPSALEPYYTSASHDVWFEDSYSAAAKFRLVKSQHLGGIALWYLGAEDTGFWPTVQADLLQ